MLAKVNIFAAPCFSVRRRFGSMIARACQHRIGGRSWRAASARASPEEAMNRGPPSIPSIKTSTLRRRLVVLASARHVDALKDVVTMYDKLPAARHC